MCLSIRSVCVYLETPIAYVAERQSAAAPSRGIHSKLLNILGREDVPKKFGVDKCCYMSWLCCYEKVKHGGQGCCRIDCDTKNKNNYAVKRLLLR